MFGWNKPLIHKVRCENILALHAAAASLMPNLTLAPLPLEGELDPWPEQL